MTTDLKAAAEYTYDDLPVDEINTETFILSYDEIEDAIIDYLRKIGDLDKREIVLSSDIPVPLEAEFENDNELYFAFDLETANYGD